MARLGTRDIPPQELDDLLGAVSWPSGTLSWVRWTMGAALGSLERLEQPLVDAVSARIFWSGGELRFQRTSGAVRCVYLGEDGLELPGFDWQDDLERSQESTIVLHNDHLWDRSALPPVSEGEVLVLRRVEYRSTTLGTFTRFAAVEAHRVETLTVGADDA